MYEQNYSLCVVSFVVPIRGLHCWFVLRLDSDFGFRVWSRLDWACLQLLVLRNAMCPGMLHWDCREARGNHHNCSLETEEE